MAGCFPLPRFDGQLPGHAKGGAVAPKSGKAQAKVHKVMREFRAGLLHSGSRQGPEVTDRKQAIAIALSEARKAAKGGYDGGGRVDGPSGTDRVDARLTEGEFVIRREAARAINAAFPGLLDMLNDPAQAGRIAAMVRQAMEERNAASR